jgi:hypothetical protein
MSLIHNQIENSATMEFAVNNNNTVRHDLYPYEKMTASFGGIL